MGTLERPVDRGTRLARAALSRIGAELRDARVGLGLSLAFVARSAGISDSELSRIELGQSPMVPVLTIARCCAVVGLDFVSRAYPGGRPVRDGPQVGLLRQLRAELGAGLGWATEVPLPIPGDQRAWDAVISGAGWAIAVEAETAPRDIQAVTRRLNLKLRDGRPDAVLLLVRDTRRTRALLRASATELRDVFPVSGAIAMAALRAGTRPPGSAVILFPCCGTERPLTRRRPSATPSSSSRVAQTRRSVPWGGTDRTNSA